MAERPKKEKGAVERPEYMPHAAEAEAGVLMALAQWPDKVRPRIAEEQVTPDWFYLSGHRRMYELITGELEAGRLVDLTTLSTRARDLAIEHELALRENAQNTWHGQAAIISLFDHSEAIKPYFSSYLAELMEHYVGRRMLSLAETNLALIKGNWNAAGLPLVKSTLAELQELASFGVRNDSVQQIKPAVMEAVNKVISSFQSRGGTLGLPTGIAALDRTINGIKTAHGYYLAGRPAMGKSALMGDLAAFIGMNPDPWAKAHVLIFSLEMTTLQLVLRELLKRSKVPLQRARDGMMSEERDFPAMHAAASDLAQSRIYVDASSALTIDDIVARTRRFVRMVRRNETDAERERREKSDRPDVVVCVDYLQRVKGTSKRAQQNRYLEVAEVCQGLSSLWKDLGIAGIVPVQLGRPDNEGPDRFPSLSDLRESGDIEAEAHVVIAMHRPDYYLPTLDKKEKWCEKHSKKREGDEDSAAAPDDANGTGEWRVGTDKPKGIGGRDLAHLAYACVLKQREGPTPQIMVHFEPSLAHFSNWNEREITYSPAEERQQTGGGDE